MATAPAVSPKSVQFPYFASTASSTGTLVHGIDSEQRDILREQCLAARENAYCPYSSFRVGATFLTKSNLLISGANVENAAYPSGTCAERVALGTAIASAGQKRGDFKALAVATDVLGKEGTDEGFCSPCGMCRQAIREFCELSMPVFMHDREGKYIVKTLGELLPMSFGPESLPPPETMPHYQHR